MDDDDDDRGKVPHARAGAAASTHDAFADTDTPSSVPPASADVHADTVHAPSRDDASAADRSPSQAQLHDRVRGALFDRRPLSRDYAPGSVVAERYRIVALLGRGGMGEVYRAHDLVLGEDVAIKFIPERFANRPEFMERFVREVRLARHITHANVCRVHDIAEVDGRTFLSMEYIDGEDLASLLRRVGRLSLTKAIELAQQLCAGLAALHGAELLHRDLKPHNLMVDGRGELKITDFGLAAEVGELAEHELRDGTPAYMAPEQAAGREVTVRSDIYALGMVLYEIITGERFDAAASSPGDDPSAAITRQVKDVPRDIEEVIGACLAHAPQDRPPSALAVAAVLPGGDPVAAALAAGRTPSIDALLATGRGRALGRVPGVALVGFVVVALLALSLSFSRWTVLGSNPDTLAPAVARHEARALLSEVAWNDGEFAEHDELRYDRALLAEPAARVPTAQRSPILYDYRRQGSHFQPRLALSMDDPPLTEPGAVALTLDGHGRLRSFRAVPAPGAETAERPADFSPLIEAAQLDAALEPATPEHAPPTFADHRRAWTGHSRALDADVRIEAASLGERVVAFEVVPQWDPRFGERQREPTSRSTNASPYVVASLIVFLFGGIAWQARAARKRGAADPRGAARVAIAVSLIGLVSVLRDPDLVAGNFAVLHKALFTLLGLGLFTYWTYMVLDPLLRRNLPGAMTSWVRLVRGRVRDPGVARDVLLGVGLSVTASALGRLSAAAANVPEVVPATITGLGSGLPDFDVLRVGMTGTPILFFMFAGLVRLVRKRWIASVLVLVTTASIYTFGAMGDGAGAVVLVAAALGGTCFGLALTQVGLLGAAVFQTVRNVLATAPLTFDLNAWYAATSWTTLVLLGLLVIYGWRYGVAAASPAPTNPQAA